MRFRLRGVNLVNLVHHDVLRACRTRTGRLSGVVVDHIDLPHKVSIRRSTDRMNCRVERESEMKAALGRWLLHRGSTTAEQPEEEEQ